MGLGAVAFAPEGQHAVGQAQRQHHRGECLHPWQAVLQPRLGAFAHAEAQRARHGEGQQRHPCDQDVGGVPLAAAPGHHQRHQRDRVGEQEQGVGDVGKPRLLGRPGGDQQQQCQAAAIGADDTHGGRQPRRHLAQAGIVQPQVHQQDGGQRPDGPDALGTEARQHRESRPCVGLAVRAQGIQQLEQHRARVQQVDAVAQHGPEQQHRQRDTQHHANRRQYQTYMPQVGGRIGTPRLHGHAQGIARALHLHMDRPVATQREHQRPPAVARVKIGAEDVLASHGGARRLPHADPRRIRVVEHQQRFAYARAWRDAPRPVADHAHGRATAFEAAFREQSGALSRLLFQRLRLDAVDARDVFPPHTLRHQQGQKQQQYPPPLFHVVPCVRCECPARPGPGQAGAHRICDIRHMNSGAQACSGTGWRLGFRLRAPTPEKVTQITLHAFTRRLAHRCPLVLRR